RVRQWIRKPRVPFERAAADWAVHILSDPNGELEPGDILVDAMLVMPGSDGLVGNRTQRIVTHRHGDQVDRRVSVVEAGADATAESAATAPSVAPAPPPATAPGVALESRAVAADAGPALATLRWRDAGGEHAFLMVTPSIKVGRGGASYWVDVK